MFRHRAVGYQMRQERLAKLVAAETKLVRSCKQIILLNNTLRGLTKRYNHARAAGYKSFRYNLRVKIATFEGTRNMYFEYAKLRAEEVAKLRKELYNENVVIVMGNNRYDVSSGLDTSSETEGTDGDLEDGN